MKIIRFELAEPLEGKPGQRAQVLVAEWVSGGYADGSDENLGYVTDAFGVFCGRPGGPGVRGSVGYAVWMEDSQRWEVLSLAGP